MQDCGSCVVCGRTIVRQPKPGRPPSTCTRDCRLERERRRGQARRRAAAPVPAPLPALPAEVSDAVDSVTAELAAVFLSQAGATRIDYEAAWRAVIPALTALVDIRRRSSGA